MPSSLVFAALAMAWIVVLVPMVARRRQEVRRTADSALAARVVRRGDAHARPEEVPYMPELDDDVHEDDAEDRGERRYRPGRGGFDPYAADLAARARYAYRQRVVLALLVVAVVSGVLAGFALPTLWWAHGTVDGLLVGYLVYLRRQVRIEQEIRQRRIDRAARGRRALPRGEAHREDHAEDHDTVPDGYPGAGDGDPPPPRRSDQRLPQRPSHPGAAVVDLDDEDPGLCDLDGELPTPYRRAAGE